MEDFVLEFTLRLLEKGILNCTKCQKILVPPVRLVNDVGNVCSLCFDKDSCSDGCFEAYIENTSLDVLLKRMRFPCIYKENGCDELLYVKDVADHSRTCESQSINCILKGCKWNGKQFCFMDHLRKSHLQDFISNDKDTFAFIVKEGESCIYKILHTSFGDFVLCFQMESNIFYFDSYAADVHLGVMRYQIELTADSETITPDIALLTKATDVLFFNKESVSKISLTDKTVSNGAFLFNIKFISNYNTVQIDDYLIDKLKCSGCKRYLKPPINMCTSGHEICGTCPNKRSSCVVCKSTLIKTSFLNEFAKYIPYPCVNQSRGCEVKSLLKKQHEYLCEYNLQTCPVCSKDYLYNTCVEHVRNSHAVNIKKIKYQFINNAFRGTCEGLSCYFVCCNRIFKLSHLSQLGKYSWEVVLIGSKKGSFYYKVKIGENMGKTVSVCGPCNIDLTASKNIWFDYSTLEPLMTKNTKKLVLSVTITPSHVV